jgi:hypothetical protein
MPELETVTPQLSQPKFIQPALFDHAYPVVAAETKNIGADNQINIKTKILKNLLVNLQKVFEGF